MCNYKAELNVTKKKNNMTLSDRRVERLVWFYFRFSTLWFRIKCESWRPDEKGKPEWIQSGCGYKPALGKLTDSRLLPAPSLTSYLFVKKVKYD